MRPVMLTLPFVLPNTLLPSVHAPANCILSRSPCAAVEAAEEDGTVGSTAVATVVAAPTVVFVGKVVEVAAGTRAAAATKGVGTGGWTAVAARKVGPTAGPGLRRGLGTSTGEVRIVAGALERTFATSEASDAIAFGQTKEIHTASACNLQRLRLLGADPPINLCNQVRMRIADPTPPNARLLRSAVNSV